ncbi:MAG: DUF1844 domain-containing protein [Candidatus Scalinduaceae bacterium]
MGEEEKLEQSDSGKTVDDEWKKKVQEEKEKVSEKKPSQKTKQQIPEASFSLFIYSLATQTLINLGEVENPFNKKKEQDLDQAKFTIDTIQIIKDKTKGNLSDDETKYLDSVLYDLSMKYVEKSK